MNPKSTVEKPRVPAPKKLSKKSPGPHPVLVPADPQGSQHTYLPFSLTIPSA